MSPKKNPRNARPKRPKSRASNLSAPAEKQSVGPIALLARKELKMFLVLTFLFSLVGYWLFIHMTPDNTLLPTMALMWSPALSALITRLYYQRDLKGMGFGIGQIKWQAASMLLPIVLGLLIFGSVWLVFGAFNAQNALVVFSLSYLPIFAVLLAYSVFCAAGEEIGWRGLLVPETAKIMPFWPMALITGCIWAAWHVPIIVFGNYHGTGPLWYSLATILPSIVGCGIILAWLRLESGSVWTGVLFHGFWNYFIQGFYPAITVNTPTTLLITGEFGLVAPLLYILAVALMWKYRAKLIPKE